MKMRWLLTPYSVLLIVFGLTHEAMAMEAEALAREYSLKAAYVFHFAELVEWPDDHRDDITLCLQASHHLTRHLGALEGQRIDDAIMHITTSYPLTMEGCQMLLLNELDELSDDVRHQARDRHILLLSDQEHFAERGGMLQFTRRDDKLHLVVNLEAVKQAGLKISSKLLRMAEILE